MGEELTMETEPKKKPHPFSAWSAAMNNPEFMKKERLRAIWIKYNRSVEKVKPLVRAFPRKPRKA